MARPSASTFAHLRIRHLQLIEALVEKGSLHKAAKHLHMSQPSASATLREVEHAFGAGLFHRTPNGVTLTREGTIALGRLRTVLSELGMLTQELHAARSTSIIRLGAVQHAYFGILQRVLPHFLKQTDVQLKLIDGSVTDLAHLLQADRLDCLIGRWPGVSNQSFRSEEFFYRPLYQVDLCVVSAPTHPLARARKLKLSDLKNAQWILPREGSSSRYVLVAALAAAGLPPPNIQLETSSFIFTFPLLHATQCLTVTPRDPSMNQQHLGVAKILPVTLPEFLPPVAFLAKHSAMLNPNVQRLWEALRDSVHNESNVQCE